MMRMIEDFCQEFHLLGTVPLKYGIVNNEDIHPVF